MPTFTFDTPGDFSFVWPVGVPSINISLYGGSGGGGGGDAGDGLGGGGGGGEERIGMPLTGSPGSYNVHVGAGGAEGIGSDNGSDGDSSQFDNGESPIMFANNGFGGGAGIASSGFGGQPGADGIGGTSSFQGGFGQDGSAGGVGGLSGDGGAGKGGDGAQAGSSSGRPGSGGLCFIQYDDPVPPTIPKGSGLQIGMKIGL